MNAKWTLACSICNTAAITVVVPDDFVRSQVLPLMKERNPTWLFFPTKCPTCQNVKVELEWKYKNKVHSFAYEEFVGELRNRGRLLVISDGKSQKRFECKGVSEGKFLAQKEILEW